VSHETEYRLFHDPLTEDECRAMMAGQVPERLRDACRAMIEFSLQTGPVDYVGMRLHQQAASQRASSSSSGERRGAKTGKRKSGRSGNTASTSRGRGTKKQRR
jgi:hypothetical protein